MVELTAVSPGKDLLPIQVGEMVLQEVHPGGIWSLAPYQLQSGKLSDLLAGAFGVQFPTPNRAAEFDKGRILWFGRGKALLMGACPPEGSAAVAAVTDQSDAWVVVELTGQVGEDVLARLVPVDLRLNGFPVGSTARTELRHMMASITRTDEESFLIMVFRSMAATLVHDLKTAMEACAARG